MIEPKGVAHFSIAVSDLDASRRFYEDVLGLKYVHSAPSAGMVFLKAGADHVILCKADTRLQRTPQELRRIHHAFQVDAAAYDAAKAHIAAQGVEIFEEENRQKGVFVGRQCYVRDPDGNVIEITEWDGVSVLD
jgi:catechol 2,3-dioxygenase-like lactoylglutathione lyase family enzyme